MFSCIFFLVFTFCYTYKININIIHSSILKDVPQLKLHHIVVLTTSVDKMKMETETETETISLDFTPINQPSPVTLFKLLAGINVPGEIRIRQITHNPTISANTDSIIENICLQQDEHISKQISLQTVQNIKNADLNNTLNKILHWETYMNLYTHNCQHFSHFVKNIITNQQ